MIMVSDIQIFAAACISVCNTSWEKNFSILFFDEKKLCLVFYAKNKS